MLSAVDAATPDAVVVVVAPVVVAVVVVVVVVAVIVVVVVGVDVDGPAIARTVAVDDGDVDIAMRDDECSLERLLSL